MPMLSKNSLLCKPLVEKRAFNLSLLALQLSTLHSSVGNQFCAILFLNKPELCMVMKAESLPQGYCSVIKSFLQAEAELKHSI